MPPSTPASSPERDQTTRLLKSWLLKGTIPNETEEWNHCSALTREMIRTVLRHKGVLDAWINSLCPRSPAEDLRPYLWTGLCQLLLLDGIPDHAAVHETVESAKKAGVSSSQCGFINAVLRKTIRKKPEFQNWLNSQLPEIRYSHPESVVRRWEKHFGEQTAHRILEWNQQRACTFARLTAKGRQLGSHLSLNEAFLPFRFTAESGFPAHEMFQLPRGINPADLPDFREGAWYIQDPSTLIAPQMMTLLPGECVLDACAAPGGKTVLLAEQLGEQSAKLTACDPSQKRCERLTENLSRLGLDAVQVLCADPGNPDVKSRGPFDAILLDVPCSNTGVYQRRPDAKWNFRKKYLKELVQLQTTLLNQASGLLTPHGRMVYSTCSIEPEETTGQIENWLVRQPGFTCVKQVLLQPGEQGCDGAFACLLQKG